MPEKVPKSWITRGPRRLKTRLRTRSPASRLLSPGQSPAMCDVSSLDLTGTSFPPAPVFYLLTPA
jgi:hypothetical protein